MKKKLILFGSGAFGLKALELFGTDYVCAFTDNACKKESEKYGVPYITIEQMLMIYSSNILLVSMNPDNSVDVIEQLKKYGINDFLLFDEYLLNIIENSSTDEFIKLVNNDVQRLKIENSQVFNLYKQLEKQLEALKSLSDIKKLNPAKGYLSYVQKDTIRIAKMIFEDIRKLDIKPFLISGTLLGLIRHGGFIPWDDDLDFGLFRNDYEKLIKYARENYICLDIKASFDEEDDLKIRRAYKDNPGKFIMFISPNCIQIAYGESEIVARKIDFFSYDYYEDTASFEEHKKLISICGERRYLERGNFYVNNIIKNQASICDESEKIYWGLDNMDSFVFARNEWFSKDLVLPLTEVEFEGLRCYKPNKAEEMLKIFYGDYLSYPKSFRCRHLEESVALKFKKNYTYIGILVRNIEDIEEMNDIYVTLRKQGIYCVYIVDDKYVNDEIKSGIVKAEVEYSENIDDIYNGIIVKKKDCDLETLENIVTADFIRNIGFDKLENLYLNTRG